MGLLTENASQYYAGEQTQVYNLAVPTTNILNWGGDTTLVATVSGVSNTNYAIYINNVLQIENTDYSLTATNQVTVSAALVTNDVIKLGLLDDALWANNGSYEYISLNDVINNFLVSPGTGGISTGSSNMCSLIPSVSAGSKRRKNFLRNLQFVNFVPFEVSAITSAFLPFLIN